MLSFQAGRLCVSVCVCWFDIKPGEPCWRPDAGRQKDNTTSEAISNMLHLFWRATAAAGRPAGLEGTFCSPRRCLAMPIGRCKALQQFACIIARSVGGGRRQWRRARTVQLEG